MDKNRAITYSIIFSLMIIFGFIITLSALSSNYSVIQNLEGTTVQNVQTFFSNLIHGNPNTVQDVSFSPKVAAFGCTDTKAIVNLNKSKDPSLMRIAQLQDICKSGVTNHEMIFITMPNNDISANRLAVSLAQRLKEFSKYGITPIVIVEPVTDWGPIDFTEFGTGFYSSWIRTFFIRLRYEGITDSQMGVWVPFPEANLPTWNIGTAKPEQFGIDVNIYLSILRTYFPRTETSILLNSLSYAGTDYNWENGVFSSLVPYIKTIKKGLVDSFGIQGFPWRSPANVSTPLLIYDPKEFLNLDLAVEAANYLGVKKIWINTGTFRSKYTNNPNLLVSESPSVRKEILDEILKEAEDLQSKGFSVSINIFAQNKAVQTEATDWSYWGPTAKSIDQHTKIFTDFIREAYDNKIPLWIFDQAQ